MIENTIKVKNRETDKVYDCFPQIIDINNDGKYTLRYNLGINGYNEWINICCIYDNDEFNASYEVVKWSKAKHAYIPKKEYKFWIDNKEAN